MDKSCSDRVAQVLGARRSSNRPDGLPLDEVVTLLMDVAPDCSDELLRTAEQELARGEALDEGSVNVLLDALVRTENPGAQRLLHEALASPGTQLKEDYVSMLEDLDSGDEAVRDLLHVLRAGLEQPRKDVAVTIRALHAGRHRTAAEAVAPYVKDSNRSVRGLAVAFLYDLDDGTVGAPSLFQSLEHETDPEILEQAIGGLDRWDWIASIPRLRQIAEDDAWPDMLREEASQVAARLTEI